MVGIILCGGQSTRMGSDKGLLKSHDVTWAQTAFDKVKALGIPVKVSVNTKQLAAYTEIFPPRDLICDNEMLKINGPLRGILSSYLQHPSEDILVLACDMPLMQTDILKELIQYRDQQPEAEALIFTNDGEPEPLCGIYTARGLSLVYDLYTDGGLSRHSMKYIIGHMSTFAIPLTDDKKKCFTNFNTLLNELKT